MGNFAPYQVQEEQAKYEIEADKADQCKYDVAIADDLAKTLARLKDAIDKPWLTSQFGRHPARREVLAI